MRLAMSNIAWAPEEASAAYTLIARHGARGLEIAPGIAFAGEADPFVPSVGATNAFLREIGAYGLALVSMQSLLFGMGGAQLFGTTEERAAFDAGMERALILAGRLGIPNLVFGSPGNRACPPTVDAAAQAGETFARLGDRAVSLGTRIAIEPAPAAYGTNFLNTAADVAAFVAALGHPGIGLNLDIGALLMNGEMVDVPQLIARAGAALAHVHVSEPHLAPAPASVETLMPIAAALAISDYPGWVSLEMRRHAPDPLGMIDVCLGRVATLLARKISHA